MDTYKLEKIDATVGMFGDFTNFRDVIDWVLANCPYKKALEIFCCDDIADLAEATTDEQGMFSEDAAKDLCMDCLDGTDEADDDPKAEWGDEMYCRQAGK